MAGYINKVILVGNVGKDPEVRLTQDNVKLANFSIATSEHWKDKESGERKTKTEWHRIVVFNENLAEVCEKYLKKGSKVYIEGQLQTRKWTDKDGQDHYKTEVVLGRFKGELCLLDTKNKEEDDNDPFDRERYTQHTHSISDNANKLSNIYLNDEVPF